MPFAHVFDLGKVLIDYDEHLFVPRLRAACRPGAPVQEVLDHHLNQIRVETGGDFNALHPLLVRDLGLTLTPDELRVAWNDIFTPIPGMAKVVEASPRPRYMLSTTNEPHATWLRERHPWVFELFDYCFLSHQVGLAKPDARLFRHVEAAIGQPPGRILFVDDLVRNVEAAREVGWRAFRFLGIEDCRRRLAQIAAEDREAKDPSAPSSR